MASNYLWNGENILLSLGGGGGGGEPKKNLDIFFAGERKKWKFSFKFSAPLSQIMNAPSDTAFNNACRCHDV